MSERKRKASKDNNNTDPPKKMNRKVEKNWSCPVCHKTIKERSRNQHMDLHSKYVKCPFCIHTLSRQDGLKRHIDTKHKSQTLRCNWCDSELRGAGGQPTANEEFPDSKTFAKHLWTHHNSQFLPAYSTEPSNISNALQKNTNSMDKNNVWVASNKHRLVDYSDDDEDIGDENVVPVAPTAIVSPTNPNQIDNNDSDNTISNPPAHDEYEMVSSSDDDDDYDDGVVNSNILMPAAALAGPPTNLVQITGDQPTDYDTYNESNVEVSASIIQQVYDQIPEAAQPLVESNWQNIRSFCNPTLSQLTQEFNRRLIGNENAVPLEQYFREQVHARQQTAYRVIAAPGFLLQNTEDPDEFRHFDAHINNNNINVPPMVDQENDTLENKENNFNGARPFLIKDQESLEHFLTHLTYQNLLDSTRRPDTKWHVAHILNVHFWIVKVVDRPIGCNQCIIPPHLRKNRHALTFTYDNQWHRFNDHLCVFRIITHVLDNGNSDKHKVLQRFNQWAAENAQEGDPKKFKGVHLLQLATVEDMFNISFNVYQMQPDETVYLVRRAPVYSNYRVVINVDLHIDIDSELSHFSLITNIEKFAKKWYCHFCDHKFIQSSSLQRHIKNKRCNRGIPRKTFIGGVHQEAGSIFESLKFIGIEVHEDAPKYNPYFAVYDFESLLQPVKVNIVAPQFDGSAHKEAFEKYGLETRDLEENGVKRKLQFFQVHKPISFAILSNVPGFDEEEFYCVDGDPNQLIKQFLDHLENVAERRKNILTEQFHTELVALQTKFDEAKRLLIAKKQANENYDMQSRYYEQVKGILGRFHTWINQIPIIGFNSGRYDLPLIKDYLYPAMVKRSRESESTDAVYDFDRRTARSLHIPMYSKVKASKMNESDRERQSLEFLDDEAAEEKDDNSENDNEYSGSDGVSAATLPPENTLPNLKGLPSVTKKGSAILCIRTENMIFLDMSMYLAAGTSLDKFQQAWMKSDESKAKRGQPPDQFGQILLKKLPFPYSFLDSMEKLDYEGVPPHNVFFSQLKGKNISNEEYELVKQIYADNDIRNFGEYLELYNRTDVKPFLQACQKQFMQYFETTGIDMFKQCISLPGITLKYLHKNTENYQFALWTKEDEELQAEIRGDMTGGLSLVMNRLAVAGETIIRGEEIVEGKKPPETFHHVKSIIGEDANALYLWAVMQDMPSGFHTLWELDEVNMKLKKKRDSKPQEAQWIQYLSATTGHEIITKFSHGFQERVGPLQIPVDGYCEATKTVYEYQGCYWHSHASSECECGTDYNERTKKSSETCRFEYEERQAYVESLGMNFVSIWECEWLEQRQQPDVIQKLMDLNRKFAMCRSIPHQRVKKAIRHETIFGFCQVTMDCPQHLREKHHFKDFPPIIKNVNLGRDHLSKHMREHCEKHGLMKKPRCSLISSFKADKQWLSTSMVSYLMSKGMKLLKIHKVLQYDRTKPFQWFADLVTEARSAADNDEAMEILGLAFKLLGNTAYGKTITDLASHTDVYIVPYPLARELANDPFLVSLEPIKGTDCYEAVLRKRNIKYSLPEQIGMMVYNWSKIRMMQFAYDFLGEFCDPYKYDWCQTDTDSCYIMLAGDSIDDIVKPEMKERYEKEKGDWFVIRKEDKRKPGLFKMEYKGVKMICLSSKTYQVVGEDGSYKSATKGINKTSTFQFDQFRKVLEDKTSVKAFNTGFQKRRDGSTCTYICERDALTYLYAKRLVDDDGIHTRPHQDL